MTLTHLSHFGLTCLGTQGDSILFEGSKGACKRMAAAHGMEIEKYEGRTLEIVNGKGITESADAGNFMWAYFVGGGFIHRGRDAYVLLMPLEVWNRD